MPVIQATCEYKRVKSCSIKADVFLAGKARSPVILYIHGGALIAGSRRYLPGYRAKLFNRAGYSVVSIDYRLAPETKLDGIVEDIRDAVRWVGDEGQKVFGFDADRMALMGSSAGGYLSLLAGTFDKKPKAIVAFYGYGDILGDWYGKPSEHYCGQPMISERDALQAVGGRERSTGNNKRYDYYLYTRQQGNWVKCISGFNAATERERLLPFCPLCNVGPDYPPTLLLHGDRDTDVPYEQSLIMAAELQKHGVKNLLITYPGGDHGFDLYDRGKPEMRAIMKRVVAFLNENV